MKNKLLLVIAFAGFIFSANSQVMSKNAIGLRLGGGVHGSGAEISYQLGLGSTNRLEFDLGFSNHEYYQGFNLNGVYQWVMPIQDRFSWYVGPGVEVGSWDYKTSYYNWRGTTYTEYHDHGFFLGIGGQIGVEYTFQIPLQLSIDYRPTFFIMNGYDGNGFGGSAALSVRYLF